MCLRKTFHSNSMAVLFKESQTKRNKSCITLETYSELCQTFKTKFFAKIANCLHLPPLPSTESIPVQMMFSYGTFYCERKYHKIQRTSNFQKNANKIFKV